MKKGLTEIIFILDKSGSMYGLERDTIGGYNAMLEKQKKLESDCKITTIFFSDHNEIIHKRVDIHAVRKLRNEEYEVGGSTALLDALGMAIQTMIQVQKHTREKDQAERVLFVIITDGMENASVEYSLGQIQELIYRQRIDYHWEFIFLGANIDAIKTATSLGIKQENAVNYHADGKGVGLNYKVMGEAISSYRKLGRVESSAFDAIREDYKSRE